MGKISTVKSALRFLQNQTPPTHHAGALPAIHLTLVSVRFFHRHEIRGAASVVQS